MQTEDYAVLIADHITEITDFYPAVHFYLGHYVF